MDTAKRYHRRVIPISAFDSPNVRLAMEQQRRGLPVTGQRVVKGVLSWEQLQHRLATWDPVQICIGVHGKFYAGAVLLLFPPERLNRCEDLWRRTSFKDLLAESMGVDCAEGGDNTAWCVGGRRGVKELLSYKTPDTNVIPGQTIELIRKWNIDPSRVCFDRGGGGQQAADNLRAKGFNVRTVAFGETMTPDLKRGMTVFTERVEQKEIKYVYKNRRIQMYHEASMEIVPGDDNPFGFAMPDGSVDPVYYELRRQLAVMPKLTDEEGRYWMLPKDKKDPDSKIKTLKELIGHSPDEADAFVLMVHGYLHKGAKTFAGAVG